MLRLIGFLTLLFIAYAIFSDPPSKTTATAPTPISSAASPKQTAIVSTKPRDPKPDTPKISDAECRKDLECYSAKFHSDATVDCRRPIEREAKNDFQWTDSWYEQKFDRRRWDDQATGKITYAGDHIKFQNGFGAWTYMKYFCIYDTVNKRVVNAFAMEGSFN